VKTLSAIEKGALVLAAVLVAGGALLVFFPSELVRTYPAATTEAGVYFPQWTEHISKSQARIYGVLAAAVGIGLAWFSFRGDRK
jgi:hypothetical protein